MGWGAGRAEGRHPQATHARRHARINKWHACLGSYKENVCSRDVQEGKVLGKDDVDGDGLEMVMANVS